jgi:uncharacterized membrane-anchored protein YhcB (DUF1043 family)
VNGNIPTLWAVVIAMVVAIVGTAGITSLLTVKAVNRKTLAGARLDEENADKADAEARKVVAEASAFLIDPLTRRAKVLEQDLATASAELSALRNQMAEMAKELTALREENAELRGNTSA